MNKKETQTKFVYARINTLSVLSAKLKIELWIINGRLTGVVV